MHTGKDGILNIRDVYNRQIKLGFVDRFSGSVIIVGSTSNVESALNSRCV